MPNDFVFTKPVRLLYTHSLITPVAFKSKGGAAGKPRYNVQALIPKDHPQLKALMDVILGLAAEKFPGADVTKLGLPLKDGDKLFATAAALTPPKDKPYYRGHMVLMAQKPEKNLKDELLAPPRLVVAQGGAWNEYADAQRILAKPFFYNGVLASLSVQFKEYPGFGGGITCYLDRLGSLNVGEHIQVGRDDEDVLGSVDSFNEYVGHVTAESVVASQPGSAASPW